MGGLVFLPFGCPVLIVFEGVWSWSSRQVMRLGLPTGAAAGRERPDDPIQTGEPGKIRGIRGLEGIIGKPAPALW